MHFLTSVLPNSSDLVVKIYSLLPLIWWFIGLVVREQFSPSARTSSNLQTTASFLGSMAAERLFFSRGFAARVPVSASGPVGPPRRSSVRVASICGLPQRGCIHFGKPCSISAAPSHDRLLVENPRFQDRSCLRGDASLLAQFVHRAHKFRSAAAFPKDSPPRKTSTPQE